MAWLSATPEKGDGPRRSKYPEGSPYLRLTELSEYETHLVRLWHEAGTVGNNGMGITALSWTEILQWADRFFSEDCLTWVKSPTKRWMPISVKQHTLLDYELQIIRQLSQEYASEYVAASDPDRPCPKEVEFSEVDAFNESIRMKQMLLEMFGKKEK